MDLEQYKKVWVNQEETTSITKKDIYKMAYQRSSSIVKWILIIGVLEFLISILLTIFNDSTNIIIKSNFVEYSLKVLSVLYYPFIFYFLYHFYKNYKKVSSTDDTKSLMNSILNTRKVVKRYILISMIVTAFVGFLVVLEKSIEELESNLILIVIIGIVVILLMLLFVYSLYHLLYGILLKKLYENYEELSNLDNYK